MNYIAERLMEIEQTAQGIVENAEREKHDLEASFQKRRDEFDSEVKEKTDREIERIHHQFDEEMVDRLTSQQEENEQIMEFLRNDYSENKEKYVKELFNKIIEV